MKFPDHAAVNAQTGFLLRKVSAASFNAFAEIVGEHGLHPMHFGMLMILAAEEPISQHELGERAGVDPSTMVARMDALEEKGLVERIRSAEDRRSYAIRLSPAGRKVLAQLRRKAKAHGDRFFAPLSAREREELHRLLLKLAEGIEGRAQSESR
jgi:DNA-binding MarR family transcriptional regulator